MNSQKKPPCKYGAKCYRNNPQHWAEFSHPGSPPVSKETIPTPTTTDSVALVTDSKKRKLEEDERDEGATKPPPKIVKISAVRENTGSSSSSSSSSSSAPSSVGSRPISHKPQLDLVRGNLLDAKEDLLVHQVNCISRGKCHGLARELFSRFPESDVYIRRAANAVPGKAEILGRVASLTGQFGSGDSKTAADSHAQREKWFNQALEDLAGQCKAKGVRSVAIPWLIGCGIGGGDWTKYKGMIEEFSGSTGIRVKFYQKQ